jgi:hypothetical protein
MDAHQHRLWLRMLKTIESYKEGAIEYSGMIVGLLCAHGQTKDTPHPLLAQPLKISTSRLNTVLRFQKCLSIYVNSHRTPTTQ